MVAAEAWYHSQCYRDYTRLDKASKHSDSESNSPSDENNYCKIESQAYDKLFEFIRSNLLENPRLVNMVDLIEKLMSYMPSMGAIKILESTKKLFRRKLEQELDDLLQFKDLLDNNKLFILPKKRFKVSTGQRDGKVISANRQQEYSL